MPVNKLGDYPAWVFIYIDQIILPMLGLVSIAIKILVRNGKDMKRELLGVNAVVPAEKYVLQKIRKKFINASDSVSSVSKMETVDIFSKLNSNQSVSKQ